MLFPPLKITYIDGNEETVPVFYGAVIALERHFGISADEVSTNPRLEHVGYLAYKAVHFEGEFDAFLDKVAFVEVTGTAPKATRQGRRTTR